MNEILQSIQPFIHTIVISFYFFIQILIIIDYPGEYYNNYNNIISSFFFFQNIIPLAFNASNIKSPNIIVSENINLRFQVQSVRNLINYYHKFYPNVTLSIPLHDYSIRDPNFKSVRFTNYTYEIPKISQYSIISAFFIEGIRNIYAFSKSTRSVSNAYIVLFIDKLALSKIDMYSSFFKVCGIIFIELPYISSKTPHYKVSDSRFVVFWMFTRKCLEHYPGYFKQIIFIDGYDTIFQEDPFDESIPSDTVYLQTEGVTFRHSEGNRFWLSNIRSGPQISYYFDKYVINAGMILGSLEAVERFLQFTLRFIIGLIDTRYIPFDQSVMSFLYYNNIYSLNNHSVVLNYPPKTSYISMTGCNNTIVFSEGNGFQFLGSDKKLKMLHQFNREERWINFLYSFYPDNPYFHD